MSGKTLICSNCGETGGAVSFLLCSCGRHGCFASTNGERGKELYTRNEVDYHLLQYLLVGEITYEEIQRTIGMMERATFPNIPHVCLLP
jgi:hypothetical protein